MTLTPPRTEVPIFIIVDLFCGFGGTTKGFEMAELHGSGIAKVIACVNHDPKAIKSHWLNNPEVVHFEEDIRTLDLTQLIALVATYRILYPDARLILWASLECTNFSKAKGGLPRDADSRTLADHLDRYILAIDPDYVKIENVVEFMSWGPLMSKIVKDKDGYQSCPISFEPVMRFESEPDRPAKWIRINGLLIDANDIGDPKQVGWKCIWHGVPEDKKNGSDWMRWKERINSYGYVNEWKELNSANYGAYTSRNRLFGVFARPHLPIAWPAPTHAKIPSKMSMYGDLKKWMPVKDVLNFEDEGESIFTRAKPLSDNTLERIYAGLVKYIAKGDTAFISKYFSGLPAGMNASTQNPAGSITTKDHHSLVQAAFLSKTYSGKPQGKNIPIDGPAGTITAAFGGSHALVQPEFLVKYNSKGKNGHYNPPSVEDPCPVVSTQNRIYLAQAEFLTHYYSGGGQTSSIDDPCPTVTAMDGKALVQPEYFIEKQYSKSQNQSIDDPAGTIMPTDKHRLVTAEPFIMPTAYQNQPKSVDEPAPTLTASRRHHYLINPSWGGHPGSIDEPCCVIIARQDKAPLYFVQVEHGPVSIAIFDNDSPVSVRIKQFMAAYGLVDIKMRMLRVPELLKIQGFPEDYKMVGNQSDQKKFIGNSVVPWVVKAWAEAMGAKLIESRKQVA